MALAERIPGFTPEGTGRNAAVGFPYFAFFPAVLHVFPFVLAFWIAENSYGWANVLSRLPGIEPSGGIKAGIAGFGYGLFAVVVIFAVLRMATGAGGPTTNQGPAGEPPKAAGVEGETEPSPVSAAPTTRPHPNTRPDRGSDLNARTRSNARTDP